jgi:zinc transporter ZupT
MSEHKNIDKSTSNNKITNLLLAFGPIIMLVLLLWAFVVVNPLQMITGEVPPIEEISFERTTLETGNITLQIRNSGPDPVTIAQVLVDEAYWNFTIEPGNTIPRLSTAVINVPYPWVEGEPHEIVLLTASGVTFDTGIEVAHETPKPDINYWLVFAVLGIYVGIVPIALGLLWLPLLRQSNRVRLNFFLALTLGLLVFLVVDTVLEGLEIAEMTPEVFQAVPLIFFAGLLSFLTLVVIGKSKSGKGDKASSSGRMWLATSIAIGIGLHNLGEGMAIGAAIALGEVALGAFLVIGFTLHNITEGIGIGAPIAKDKPKIGRLALLVLIAGGPAILGTWMGGFAFNPILAVLFLSIGAGAILQVIYEVSKLLLERKEGAVATPWVNMAGLVVGIALMYLTAFLVK